MLVGTAISIFWRNEIDFSAIEGKQSEGLLPQAVEKVDNTKPV